jgi:Arc/MetJ-type ribon-helix-helix transcriptional regulator
VSQEKADRADRDHAAPDLSALEHALRHALESAPRDRVVKCIVSVLPADVFVEETGRLHSGRVRKVSVSMPEELAEAVRARTGSGGFSRYVTEAVQEQMRISLLDELSAELQAEFGQFNEDGVRQAMRLWTDFDEEES